MPERSASALSTWADRSAGWTSFKPPFRLPIGVRTASTITASRMATLFFEGRALHTKRLVDFQANTRPTLFRDERLEVGDLAPLFVGPARGHPQAQGQPF